MTYEVTYGVLWILAVALFAIHSMFKRGGIMSAAAMTVMFTILFFSSSNVTASTSAGLVATRNPMAGWLALFMAVLSVLILFMSIVGIAGYGTNGTEEGEPQESAMDIAERI